MPRKTIGALAFSSVYPAYLAKVERKGRTRAELDTVIRWLTGYDDAGLARPLTAGSDFETFFGAAPSLHPTRAQITGKICGVRIEDIEDPLERKVRQLDKLVDELAQGRKIEAILRP